MTDDRYDPTQLIRQLKGGISRSNGKEYIGLEQRVTSHIRSIYRIPVDSPQTGSVIKRGRGRSDEFSDPTALAEFLTVWMPPEDRDRYGVSHKPPHNIDGAELLRIHTSACRVAFRKAGGRYQEHVSARDAEDVIALLGFYIGWLGRECKHLHEKDGVCPDCGLVQVA